MNIPNIYINNCTLCSSSIIYILLKIKKKVTTVMIQGKIVHNNATDALKSERVEIL